MKFNSIKQKLIFYFVSIISMFVLVSVVFGILHFKIVKKYENIENNIFLQNHLITATAELIKSYNDYRNTQDIKNLDKYHEIQNDIRDTIANLKNRITEEDSKNLLYIVNNTIESVFTETDKGIKSIKEDDITNTSFYYTEANRKFDFVKENTANLILKEIDYSIILQKDVQKTQKLAVTGGSIMLVLIMLGSILFSVFWSRRLVSPILEINLAAKEIADGKLERSINKDLLKRRDEIGSMSRSFNNMSIKLRESRNSLEDQIKETEAKSVDLGEQVEETKKSKLAIMNLLEDLDIEKKKVEETVVIRTKELRAEKARLLASINSLSFGFIIADMENRVILKNKAMSDLFNFGENDVVTIDNVSLLLGEHIDLKMQVERCFSDKASCEIKEIIFGTKFLRGIVAPVIAEGSEDAIGYVFLLEDITEAKVIERSREEFFAVASHELRTPLTAIRGNMATFRDYGDTMDEKEKKEIVSDTYDASIRLIGIVNDFLDTSRLEQGKAMFNKESVDLLPIIRDTCKEIEPLAKEKSLTLNFVEPTKSIPMAFTDKMRIKQAISNFVDNAVKYTDKGSVTVTIDNDNKSVSVSVTDTGKGISVENQSLLFRKFQQAGENMLARDVSKSTGLGLYINKLVIEAMGGTVGLTHSTLGEGSTFTLTIPIAQ